MAYERNGKVPEERTQPGIRVGKGRERVLLHHRGKAPGDLDDLLLLEELEDRLDVAEAASILADAEARGQKPIPWRTAKKKLGL